MLEDINGLEINAGLNVNLDPSIRLKSEGEIRYSSGNKLVFWPNAEKDHTFEYRVGRKRLVLNNLLENKNWAFVPVSSPFRVCFSEDGILLTRPEIQLNIRDLQDELAILSSLHEVGHAHISDHLNKLLRSYSESANYEEINGFLRKMGKERKRHPKPQFTREYLCGTYNRQLFFTRLTFMKLLGKRTFEKFDERSAWSYALSEMRRRELLPHISPDQVRDYYRGKLATYGKDFIK